MNILFSTQKRNDREEIRRRLAMGAEDDYLTKISTAKPGRKPSLQSRLQEGKCEFLICQTSYNQSKCCKFSIQTGKNLQICFVNDAAAAADGDSLSSDSETCPKLSKVASRTNQPPIPVRHGNITPQANPYNSRPLSMKKTASQEKGTISRSKKKNENEQKIKNKFFVFLTRIRLLNCIQFLLYLFLYSSIISFNIRGIENR